MFLALVMVLSAFPISAFAAPASDIPDKMLDNPIVRALAYTGYNVQKGCAHFNYSSRVQKKGRKTRSPQNANDLATLYFMHRF